MLNIFQNLTASSLYMDFNDPTDLSKVLRRTNISLCQTQVAACYQNSAHKIKETTSVWHTRKVARIGCPGPATSKRKSRTTAIFDRTLEHSPRACTHVHTEIAYKQHFFWRGQDRFASQFSANHIQFRIAKLRFCIANCDAIPDKFIPAKDSWSITCFQVTMCNGQLLVLKSVREELSCLF